MNRKKAAIIAVFAAIALAAVPFVYAQRGSRAAGRGGDGMQIFGHLQRIKADLGLSDQQVSDLKAIAQSLREQNAPYRQSVRGGMKDAFKTLLANPNDISGAQAVLDKQAAAERTARQNVLQAAAKALNVLTPEQRAKLGERMERRFQRD